MTVTRTTHSRQLNDIEGKAVQMAIKDRPMINADNAPIMLLAGEEGGKMFVTIGRADDAVKIHLDELK